MYFLLMYDVVSDYVERRTPFRPEHLDLLRKAHQRGEVVMAGAFGDPPEGALFVFRGDGPAAAEAFAKNDPYVKNGVVTAWRIKPWNVVVGQT